MGSKYAARRQRLFDLYSRNLAFFGAQPPDIFVCPLCMDGLTREALQGPEPEVTLAHVIPQKLGGRLTTLCCDRCNHTNGHALETHLVERLRTDDCLAGVGHRKGRLSLPFGDITVEYGYSPAELAWKVYGIPEASNRNVLNAIPEYHSQLMSDPTNYPPLCLMPQYRHQPSEVKAAVYQSAFLLMFSYFGYEFLFHPHFCSLREQVVHPEKDIFPSVFPVLSDTSAATIHKDRPYAVVFANDPPVILVLLRMRPKGGISRSFVVVLPGLNDPVVPAHKFADFQGIAIAFRPELLGKTGSTFRQMWAYTRKHVPSKPS